MQVEPERIRWHPILAAKECEPGHWEMFAQYEVKYGDVRLVRRDGTLGYRAMVLRPGSTAPIEAGFTDTLRAAVEKVHAVWIRNHGVADGPHANWS